MLRTFFIFLGIYLLYRFIFDFFIPIYKASRKVHRQFQHMQQEGPENPSADARSHTSAKKPGSTAPPPSSKDYIDFEEIKD